MNIYHKICNGEKFQNAMMGTKNLLIVALNRRGEITFVNEAGAKILGYKPEDMLGKNWFENFLPDEIKNKVFKVFKSVINGRLKPYETYQNSVKCKNGTGKIIHFTNSIVKEKSNIIGTLSVGIDITEYATKSEELQRLKDINEILINASKNLNKAEDISIIGDVVVKAAKELTDSKYGFVGYIDEKTGYLYIPEYSRGVMAQCRIEKKEVVFKKHNGLLGWAIKYKRPVLSNDVSNDKRAVGLPRGHIKIEKFLGVPVIQDDKVIGLIAVANSKRDYNDNDITSLERLADLYIPALERARTHKMFWDALNKYNLAVNIAGQLVYKYYLDTGKIEYEGNYESLLGYNKDELPDTLEGVMALIHPDDRDKLKKTSAEALDYIETQFRLKKKDNKYIHISLKGYTIKEKKSGERVRYGMLSDISDRIKYEEVLIEKEREIRELFENIPIPTAVMDKFKNIIFINKTFTETYGYEKGDISNFSEWINVAFPFATEEDVKRYINLVFKNERDIEKDENLIIKMIGKDKRLFYIKFLKKIIGKNIVLMLENITEEVLKGKKIKTINKLLQLNTDINRMIANLNSEVDIINKILELFISYDFKDVSSYLFIGNGSRELVRIDRKGVNSIDSDEIPLCVKEAMKNSNEILFIKKEEDCRLFKYYNHFEEGFTIVLSLMENNIVYGTINITHSIQALINEDELNILKGIAKDIAFKLNSIDLNKKNLEYINKINNIARFPAENPNPILRINKDGIILFANPASQILSQQLNTEIGSNVPDFIKRLIDYAIENNIKYESDIVLNEHIYNAYIVPFVDSGYVNIYFIDVTDKKKKEIFLKESEERFRKLFDESPVAFYLQDENMKFIDGNEAAEKLLGYNKSELIGKDFVEANIVPVDKIEELVDLFKKVIHSKKPFTFITDIIRKDGERRKIEAFVRFMILGGKNIILGVAYDVTEKIKMQEEIVKFNDELKRLSNNLKEEVEKKTLKIKKSEKMAILIKNILTSVWNLESGEDILKEVSSYIAENMNFKAYGYYLPSQGENSVKFFLNNNLSCINADYNTFNEIILKNFVINYNGLNKLKRLFKYDFSFFPEFAEEFDKECREVFIVPVIYKDISYGFMLFFVPKESEIDDIILDGLDQLSIHIGMVLKQKRVEIERERLNKLYNSVLSSAGDGIIGTDRSLNIIFANKSALNILGCNEEMLLGYNIHNILHIGSEGEFHSMDECPFYGALNLSKTIVSEDKFFYTSDGRKINVNTIVTPIIENDICSGIVVVFRDITEEKRKRDEINKLSTAFKYYPIPMGFIDNEGNIKHVNDAFVRHTGISENLLLNMNIDEINKGTMNMVKKEQGGSPYHRQYTLEKEVPDSNKKNMFIENITVSPLPDSKGGINGYVVIKEDITSFVEIQESHKVAREEAEKANRAKTAFLATITHEMRTPLTAIKGFINQLESTELNNQQREIVRKVIVSTDHMVTLINDVLDYSKIEAGQMEIENIGFDLFELLEDVKSITSIKIREKGLGFNFEIEDGIPGYLRGDSHRLKQILINLISNATKFTENGEISIKVSKKDIINSKNVVLYFSVKDTGIGIKQEDRVKIFDPFQQVDSSISRKFGGTGLGLAISRYFVEKMNGDIWVDSEYGKGSNFQFTAEFEIIDKNEIKKEEKFIPPAMMLGGARVLLVEDNEFNQEIISNLLKKYGADVEFATNGKEAVDIIFSRSSEYYNFVLMDIQMPIMDGRTATRMIKSNENYKNLPIIAMTAHAFKDDVKAMLKDGMIDYIPKPFDESQALKVISVYYTNKSDYYNHSISEKTDMLIPDHLLDLSCIDLKKGLERLSNDVDAYTRMLKKFVLKYKNISEEIGKLIEENRFNEAENLVHTIKGVSGNLSIKNIYEKSLYLDNLLKTNAPKIRIKEAFRSFSNELSYASKELEKLPNENKSEVEIVNEDIFKQRIDQLIKMLKGGDTDSLKIFEQIEGNLIKEIGTDNVDKIKMLIENFSHLDALDLLRKSLSSKK